MTHVPTLRVKFWTPNKVQQLLDLNEEELSGAEIGKRIGCSRHAATCKLLRMGHTLKHAAVYAEKAEIAKRPPRMPPDPVTPAPSPDEPASLNISMMDVKDGMCKFISGDPAQGATLCGNPTLPNRSWCEFHFRRCFQPAKPYVPQEFRS